MALAVHRAMRAANDTLANHHFFTAMMNIPGSHGRTPRKMAWTVRGIFESCRATLRPHSTGFARCGSRFFQCILMVAMTLVLQFSIGKAAEGGLLPGLPRDGYFEGVNSFGLVSIWKQIGKIDAGGGLQIPLNLNFRPNHFRSSPLGAGWALAILDANIVQVDENTFKLSDPNGMTWDLWRDKKQPNKLLDGTGWKAEISQDMIVVWKNDGMKMEFKRGRITSFQTNGRTFNYIYENGQIVGLQENNRTLFQIRPTVDPSVKTISVANFQDIKINMSERPVVQDINGVKVISGKVQSLSQCTLSDGSLLAVSYGVDDKINPTIEIGDQLLTWNPSNAQIISAGKWNYDIVPDKDPMEYAKISRKSSTGECQSWYMNKTRGMLIMVNNGIETKREWFVTGLLAGKPRKILQNDGKETHLIGLFFYDEKAQLIRTKRDQADTFWVREPDGRLAALVQNGKLLYTYTENGAKLAQKFLAESKDNE